LEEHVQFWVQAWINGDFKQRSVEIIEKLLKTADDVVQLVHITAPQTMHNCTTCLLKQCNANYDL